MQCTCKIIIYLVLSSILLTGCVGAGNVESIESNSSTNNEISYTEKINYSIFSDIKESLLYNISPTSYVDFEKKIPRSEYFLKGLYSISYGDYAYVYAEDVVDFTMVEDILVYLTKDNQLHINIKSCPVMPLPNKNYTKLSLSPLGLLLAYNNESVLEIDIFNCMAMIELKKEPETSASTIGPFLILTKGSSLNLYFVGEAQKYDTITMPFDISAVNMSSDGKHIYILDVLGDLAIYSIGLQGIIGRYNVGTYSYKAYIDGSKDIISYLYNNQYNLVKIEQQELSNISSFASWEASLVKEHSLAVNYEECDFSIYGGYLKCNNNLFYTEAKNLSSLVTKEVSFLSEKFAFRQNVYYYLSKDNELLVHSSYKRDFDDYSEEEFNASFACLYQDRYLYFLDVDREVKFYDMEASILASAAYSNFCKNAKLENGSYVDIATGEKLYLFAEKVNENSDVIMYRRDINNSKYYFFEDKD